MITLKIKHVQISSGTNICFLHEKDAKALDLRQGERVHIGKGKKSTTAIVDVTWSSNIEKPGYVGLLDEAYEKLGLKENTVVNVSLVEKPLSLHYIKNKLKGQRLKDQEIYEIIKDIVDGNLSEIEITYFVSGCHIHALDMKETVSLTNAIINTGDILKLRRYPIADKHCVGGVPGNRTTMIMVPLMAALGFTLPKTSARSITSPAGTADTMEALCPVSFGIKKIKKIVEKTNACIVWGGGVNTAPADNKIIRVEHPVNLDPTGQLLASIMAKKKAVSASHLLVDIPYGRGAKIDSIKHAKELKRKFENIAKKLHIKPKVIITDGSQPVGNGIGPLLEARDVLWVFERDRRKPLDLEEKGLHMAALLIELTKQASYKDALGLCQELLETGEARKKFIEILKAQGGKIFKSSQLKPANLKKDILAHKGGVITHIENKKIARIARICGAPGTKSAGIYLIHHVGAKVEKGDPVMKLYSENKEKLRNAVNFYEKIGGIKIN